MASVGTVSVKVVPDLDGFADAIRQEVRRIVREEIAVALGGVRDGLRYDLDDVAREFGVDLNDEGDNK